MNYVVPAGGPPPPTEEPPPTADNGQANRRPPPPPEDEYVPPPPPPTTEQVARREETHSHLAMKATPTTIVQHTGERRIADQNREIVPKAPAETPPPLDSCCASERRPQPPPPPPEEEFFPPPVPTKAICVAQQDSLHSHLIVKATPTKIIQQMSEERQADRNRVVEAKAYPGLTKMPADPPQRRERCPPSFDRRSLLHYATAQQSYQRAFQAACKDSQALVMIYEKLMQIEGAMEDAEDRYNALDCREKGEESAIKKMHEALGELHELFADNWRNQQKERDLFIAAICELTRKLESVQARNDQFHWAFNETMKDCKNKVTQVHFALSDITEILGEAKKTIREANETIKQLQRSHGGTAGSSDSLGAGMAA